jgi:hypothetical protein
LGPYRYGGAGLQYLGHSVEDLIPNLDATGVKSHGVYKTDLKQVWFWLASGTSNNPENMIVLDVMKAIPEQDGTIRKGWSKYTGSLASTLDSTLGPATLGASMSSALKPYVARSDTDVVFKADDTSLSADGGVAYQAFVKTKALDISGLTKNFGMGKAFLLAKKSSDTATKIDITLERDFGVENRTFTIALDGDTAIGTDNADRVVKTFDTDMADAGFVEIQIGDTGAVAKDWQLDAIEVLITKQETR